MCKSGLKSSTADLDTLTKKKFINAINIIAKYVYTGIFYLCWLIMGNKP